MLYDIEHFDTRKELISELRIAVNKNVYFPAILYSIKIGELKKNDIITVSSCYELTNNYKFNVMIGGNISLSLEQPNLKGIIVDEGRGYNITPSMHHGSMYHVRQFNINNENPGIYYLNTIVWAASDAANPNLTDKLKIEQGYGHLDVLIYRSQ